MAATAYVIKPNEEKPITEYKTDLSEAMKALYLPTPGLLQTKIDQKKYIKNE